MYLIRRLHAWGSRWLTLDRLDMWIKGKAMQGKVEHSTDNHVGVETTFAHLQEGRLTFHYHYCSCHAQDYSIWIHDKQVYSNTHGIRVYMEIGI